VRLFNGDVGVVSSRDPDEPTRRLVAFPTPDGGVRIVLARAAADPEPVFAMSVHKSQGSQFARVVLVLPTAGSPLLSRELVYTGITRASEHVTVVATEERLREALGRDVQRASGLARRLWGTDER
jgi:exodeoxyribonuclease V alpha subunit